MVKARTLIPAVRPIILAVLCLIPRLHAAVIYDTESSFTSQLQPGYYQETFESLDGDLGTTSRSFPAGNASVSYTLSTVGGTGNNLFALALSGSKAISPSEAGTGLSITFSGSGVSAFGARFGLTEANDPDNPLAAARIRILINGTDLYTPMGSDSGWSFFGITSDTPITSLTFSTYNANDANFYVNVGDTFAPVPESSTVLSAVGLCIFAGAEFFRTRRGKRSAHL
jgi:hypothetical protein